MCPAGTATACPSSSRCCRACQVRLCHWTSLLHSLRGRPGRVIAVPRRPSHSDSMFRVFTGQMGVMMWPRWHETPVAPLCRIGLDILEIMEHTDKGHGNQVSILGVIAVCCSRAAARADAAEASAQGARLCAENHQSAARAVQAVRLHVQEFLHALSQ